MFGEIFGKKGTRTLYKKVHDIFYDRFRGDSINIWKYDHLKVHHFHEDDVTRNIL